MMMLLLRISVLFSSILLATGCAVMFPKPAETFDAALPVIVGPPPAASSRPYRIGAGDELAIKFFFAPELNETMRVRPDGNISLSFIQDIAAAGRTPEELGKEIRRKLRKTVKQPDVVVVVTHAASSKVFIGGEVGKPGSIVLRGDENLLQVLSDAGWVTPAANRHEVALVRADATGKSRVYELDLDRITSGEDPTHNVALQAGDMIMVPPSDITSFDRWVDQHIRLATPLPGSFVFTNQHTIK